MDNKVNELNQLKAEKEERLKIFAERGDMKIVNRLQKEIADIENRISILSVSPTEEEVQTFEVDSTLQKLYDKATQNFSRQLMLINAGRGEDISDNTMRELQRLHAQIEARELLFCKTMGCNKEDIRPTELQLLDAIVGSGSDETTEE